MRRSKHRLSSLVLARRWGGAIMMGAIYLSLGFVVVLSELLAVGEGMCFALAIGAVGSIMVVGLTPGSVIVGADGIAVSRLGHEAFTPHHAVRATRVDGTVRSHQRLVIAVDEGEVVLPFPSRRASHAFVRDFRRFFKLSRRKPRRVVAPTRSYRGAPHHELANHDLRNVNAEPCARAMGALRAEGIAPSELARLAAATAHPTVARVLEALANGDRGRARQLAAAQLLAGDAQGLALARRDASVARRQRRMVVGSASTSMKST